MNSWMVNAEVKIQEHCHIIDRNGKQTTWTLKKRLQISVRAFEMVSSRQETIELLQLLLNHWPFSSNLRSSWLWFLGWTIQKLLFIGLSNIMTNLPYSSSSYQPHEQCFHPYFAFNTCWLGKFPAIRDSLGTMLVEQIFQDLGGREENGDGRGIGGPWGLKSLGKEGRTGCKHVCTANVWRWIKGVSRIFGLSSSHLITLSSSRKNAT